MAAAALGALGAELGIAENRASEENRKGFFEHPEIVAFNEALLAHLGTSWDSPVFEGAAALEAAGLAGGGLEDWIADGAALVARLAGTARLAATKDPRLCLLLPAWLQILRRAGYGAGDVRLLISIRDPVAAAKSQQLRQRADPDYYAVGARLPEGAALWMSHAVQALEGAGTVPALMVDHAQMLTAPARMLDRIAQFLGVTADPERRAAFARDFVDDALNRSHPGADERAEVAAALPQLAPLHARLVEIAQCGPVDPAAAAAAAALHRDPDAQRAIDRVARGIVDRLAPERRAAAVEAAHLRETRAELHTVHAEQLAALRTTLAEAEAARDARDDQLAALTAETRRQAEAAEAERARIAQDYDDRIATFADALAQAETARDTLAEQIDALQAENHRQAEAAEAERARIAQDYDAEVARLRTALDAAEAARDGLAAEHAHARAALQTEAETLRERAEQAEQARADLGGRLEASIAEQARIARDHEAEHARVSAAYRGEIAKRDAVLDAQEERIAALLESRSWRITAPLRAAGRAGAGMNDALKARWSGLNHRAREGYRSLSARNPRLADGLRRVLWPLLRAGNRRLMGADRLALAGAATDLHLAHQTRQTTRALRPLVSVIVPNYNHAPYLRQRLDSIYAQSYDNFEVLLLDDASNDDSRAILRDYAEQHPERTRLLFNEANSGGPFRQWAKGLRQARGELVWIAESDDWCSANLLETLVPFFDNSAVQLAYAPTVFMDAQGEREVWSMDAYLADLGPERWHRPWVTPAPEIVRAAFAIRNIVPNAGSALLRRSDRLAEMPGVPWQEMRCCGDWALYLNAIRGGLMAYSPDARNYFRQHRSNSSVAAYQHDSYYREHEQIAREVMRHYKVDPELFESQRAGLMDHWRRNRGGLDPARFARCFDLSRIAAAAQERRPAVLMASYGFCAGGGETFGIELANRLKAGGHSVTFLDCAQEAEAPGLRARLGADIPVVSNLEDLDGITRAFDIDIIHSHHAWVDNTILDLLPEDSPARSVVTLHGMYETIPARELDRIVPRMLARTRRFVHVSAKNAAPFAERGADLAAQFRQIDNAVAAPAVTSLTRAALDLPEDSFVLVLASRAIAPKGWQEAIEAVAQARALSGRDIRLVLLGSGPVQAQLARSGVPAHVLLRGFRSDVAAHFALADMGLLPSRFAGESFPLAVVECLLAGRPVIATALGEVPRMLDSGGGRPAGALIELSDGAIPVAALAREIARFATTPHAHAAACARAAAAARRFDPDLMAARYAALYDEALQDVPRLVRAGAAGA